jgi:hypothetical protein
MSPFGSTPIRPITGRPSLAPASFTRWAVRSPCGFPSGAFAPESNGLPTFRVCNHRGEEGDASSPVARHPRGVSSEHPSLATYLLVQACQPLWLVRG